MKILILSACLLVIAQVSFGQREKFIENVLSDFKCRDCVFLALDVISEDFSGKVVVDNDDLYRYIRKSSGLDELQYKAYVKNLLTNNEPLQLKNVSLDKSGNFIRVENGPERFVIVENYTKVDEIASKGCQTFIKYYFLGETLESIKNSASLTCHEFIDSQKQPLRRK